MYKKSKNPVVEELTKSLKDRKFNLSGLNVVEIDKIRYCCWCLEGILKHRNRKYCTEECRTAAFVWAYPQVGGAPVLLKHQDYKCAHCNLDYIKITEEKRKELSDIRHETFSKIEINENSICGFWSSWLDLKYRPEVDHIVPISKGGQSLGLENHQLLCYTCHKKKTKVDNSGPRIKDK